MSTSSTNLHRTNGLSYPAVRARSSITHKQQSSNTSGSGDSFISSNKGNAPDLFSPKSSDAEKLLRERILTASYQHPEYSLSKMLHIANQEAKKLKLGDCDPKDISHLIVNDTYKQAINLYRMKNSLPQQSQFTPVDSLQADSYSLIPSSASTPQYAAPQQKKGNEDPTSAKIQLEPYELSSEEDDGSDSRHRSRLAKKRAHYEKFPNSDRKFLPIARRKALKQQLSTNQN